MAQETNDCCTSIYPAKCVQYQGSTNTIATNNEYLNTIIQNIATYISTYLDKTYDISCLPSETATAANLNTTVQAMLDELCSATVPLFDATCLGGSATATMQETTALLLTRVCTHLSPSFDITCLGGGASDDLSTTVNALITKACSAITATVNWGCLTDPGSTDLDDVLQGIIDELINYTYTFSTTWFSETPGACGTVVAIDETKLVDEIKDNVTLLEAFNTYITNNISYKVFKGETCFRNYLADTLSFEAPLSASKECYSLYTYRIDSTGLYTATSVFTGITLPSGVFYAAPDLLISDPAAIETWLTTNLDIVSASVSTIFVNPTYTLRVVISTHGNGTDVVPKVHTKITTTSDEIITNPVEALSTDPSNICCSLRISTSGSSDSSADECGVDVVGSNGIDVSTLTTNRNSWKSENYAVPIVNTLDSVRILGKTYTPPSSYTVDEFTNIENWLNSIGIGTFTVTGTVAGPTTSLIINFTGFTTDTDTELYPYVTISGTDYIFDLLSVGSETCDKFHVQQAGKTWENVSYSTSDYSGFVQYRLIGDRVEVKGGEVTLENVTGVTATSIIDAVAFTIPHATTGSMSMGIGAEHEEEDGGTTTTRNYTKTGIKPHKAFVINESGSGDFKLFFRRGDFDATYNNAEVPENINSTVTSTVTITWLVPSFSYYV